MRLLTLEGEGCSSSSRDFLTFQLMTREWKLFNHVSNDVHEVTGDGVIGIYSLFSEGEHRRDSGIPNFSRGDVKIRPFKHTRFVLDQYRVRFREGYTLCLDH